MNLPAPASSPAPVPKDPLGRNTPQSSIYEFLEACHARDYEKAIHYLDLRRLPAAERSEQGPVLAKQLEDLLDDTPFSIATLSREPEGDQYDGLPGEREWLDTFRVEGKELKLQLERVELKPNLHVWVVAADSVVMIPEAHQLISETPFEKKLPQKLVSIEIWETPVWRWIALGLIAPALWFALTFALRVFRGKLVLMRGALRLGLFAVGMGLMLRYIRPATLPRLYLHRGLGLLFTLALAWAASDVVDLIVYRWHEHLDPRVQAVRYSVLPLGRQVLRILLFMIAVLSVLSAWGYNTSTILAGLGVGGLAVALAAQKTIENLFGGVSVIGDRPVLVGDVCRFGDRVGTVMRIGLRSTQIRTPERTIISVPNAQFSAMSLENVSGRDKIWFHPTLNLRRDTTSEQMHALLFSIKKILEEHPKVETGAIPVRFVGLGSYSLDVEVNVYVTTSDFDEFLAIQQELLLKILAAVEQAGTGLAVPLQESIERSATER